MAREVQNIDSRTLKAWMETGDVVLIDVRPPEKFAEERIATALSMPLASLERGALPDLSGKRLVFQCQVGVASERAGRKILGQGFEGDVHHLVGGISAWKRAGLSVTGPGAGRVSIQRQVQITSGTLVLIGVVLGATASPWFHALAAFIGAGTLFAGITGTCGMARMLGLLPYNRNETT